MCGVWYKNLQMYSACESHINTHSSNQIAAAKQKKLVHLDLFVGAQLFIESSQTTTLVVNKHLGKNYTDSRIPHLQE